MTILRIVLFILLLVLPLSAQRYPSQVKKSASFIFSRDTTNRLAVQGTGFFVLLRTNQGNDSANFGYLVTTKRALQGSNGKYLDTVYIRINRKDGYSDTLLVVLMVNGEARYFPHPDSTVDLALIPAFPDINRFDMLYIPASMIAPADYFARERVTEGMPVFHVGMLEEHLGTFKNIPTIRFGSITQFSDEKYRWNGMLTEFYLMEPGVTHGSAGAPVYHYSEAMKDTAGVLRPARLAVCGIVAGAFRSGARSGEAARVTPSYKLNELLMTPGITAERDKEFVRMRGEAEKK